MMTVAESRQFQSPGQTKRPRGLLWWLEQLLPRLAGVFFLWTGLEKAYDTSRIERVLAFDGIPEPLVPAAALIVWAGEIALGLALLAGIARRRTIAITIFVLLVFSLQLAYLIVAQNAPSNCGCIQILRKYQSAHQAMVTGLAVNAGLAICLEWVRLRILGRERARNANGDG